MANIKDVARAAEVSISTVSHVLRGTAPITPAVQERVRRAAAELGYRPNPLGRTLLHGRTQAIGLLVSDITNPFFSQLARALERPLSRKGYEVLLCNTDYDDVREQAFVEMLVSRRVAAVAMCVGHTSTAVLRTLARAHVPAVVHWHAGQLPAEMAENFPGVRLVGLDIASGLTAAAEHLYRLGHRQLALLAGPAGLEAADSRRDAFLAAVQHVGIDPDSVTCLQGDYRFESGRRATHLVLQARERPKPTAIVAGNDVMAFGVLRALREVDIQVPASMSVVGFDDSVFTAGTCPPLTTVRLPAYRMGLLTARLLVELLEGPAAIGAEHIVLPTRLVIRESTGPAPKTTPAG